MVKSTKVILALVFVVIVMWMGSIIYAQPNISKEKIPRDTPTLVRQLIETLYVSDPTERTDAVYGLGPLIGALKDKDSVVRATAAQTLGTIAYVHPKEERRVVEPLIEALRDEEECVRYTAAVFLAAIEDTRVLQPLIVALKDGSSGVRLYAAKALGIRKNPLAVEPLIDVLEDENRHVRESAGKALSKITGQNFGQDAEKWQKWWEENKNSFSEENSR